MTRRLCGSVVALLLLAGCAVGASRPQEVLCEGDVTYHGLAAQAVPTATLLPCVRAFPAGWTYGGSQARNGVARFWLDSDRAGFHAVEVTLARSCSAYGLADVTNASGELDVQVYLEPISKTPFVADRHFVFEGGCVTYRYRFGEAEQAPLLALEADDALTFLSRSELVALAEEDLGLTLCGAGAPPCVGED